MERNGPTCRVGPSDEWKRADLTGEIAIDLHRGALDARRLTGQVSLDLGRG